MRLLTVAEIEGWKEKFLVGAENALWRGRGTKRRCSTSRSGRLRQMLAEPRPESQVVAYSWRDFGAPRKPAATSTTWKRGVRDLNP